MKNRSLMERVKHYSNLKTWGVLPFSITAILATVVFVSSMVLSLWFMIPLWVAAASAACMMIGIVVPIFVIFVGEKEREKMTRPDNQKLLIEYLDLFTHENIKSIFLYYDMVELLNLTNRRIFLFEGNKDKKIEKISNALNRIFQENSGIGLANDFVYKNRQGFAALCDYIVSYYKSEDEKAIWIDGIIYNKYLEFAKTIYENNLPVSTKQILLRKRLVRYTKIALLIACGSTYFDLRMNPYIFNFTAIFLLFIDIMQNNEKD